jgi:tRNA wybutosine-synthesizing protein 4
MGGSAVCFSFGTFWNRGCFTIRDLHPTPIIGAIESPKSPWKYLATGAAKIANAPKIPSGPHTAGYSLTEVARVKIQSSEDFIRIAEANKPVIIEESSLGSCTEIWTADYLKQKIGSEREVSKPLF